MTIELNQVEKLIAAADQHAKDTGEPDHAVGDLQDLLRQAWALMDFDQRRRLLLCDAAENVLQGGSPGEDPQSLAMEIADEMRAQIVEMQNVIREDGCQLRVNDAGMHFWENRHFAGEDFYDKEDAIIDGYNEYLRRMSDKENSKPAAPKS